MAGRDSLGRLLKLRGGASGAEAARVYRSNGLTINDHTFLHEWLRADSPVGTPMFDEVRDLGLPVWKGKRGGIVLVAGDRLHDDHHYRFAAFRLPSRAKVREERIDPDDVRPVRWSHLGEHLVVRQQIKDPLDAIEFESFLEHAMAIHRRRTAVCGD